MLDLTETVEGMCKMCVEQSGTWNGIWNGGMGVSTTCVESDL